MATNKSDQYTDEVASPPVMHGHNEVGAPVRKYFKYTVPVGDEAANNLIQLVSIPDGSRILGGLLVNEAMSTGGGDASVQVGDGTTVDKYLGTTSVDAAGSRAFANTAALFFGQELSAAIVLTAKVLTEDWLAGAVLSGYVDYLP